MTFLAAASIANASGGGGLDVHEARLDNGLRILVVPQHHLPMVVAALLVDAGSRLDPRGQEGVAGLTAELLAQGTTSRSRHEFHEAVDRLGARFSTNASDDMATASLTTLKEDFPAGLELLADAVVRPAIDPEEFARKRDEALAEIEAEKDDAGSVSFRVFRKAVYGDGAYRTPTVGTKEALEALEIDDVRVFHAGAWQPGRSRIVIAGDMEPAEAVELVRGALGTWQATSEPPEVPPLEPRQDPGVVRVDRDFTQANIVWGHRGTTRDDPDWYALQVMNHIFGGGGFSSRLMKSIRTEAGLAYSVHSGFSGKKQPGAFQVVLQTRSDGVPDAMARLKGEVERIRTELVDEQEIDEAKKYLTGSFPLRIDSNSKLVGFYSQIDFYGIGLDYPDRYDELINGVTREDIRRVAHEYIRPDDAILVIVGRDKEIPSLPE